MRDASPLPRLKPRADIQGLRALAVGLVILDHAGVQGLRGGFIGVDVFFVVSGFLISSLLLHEASSTGRVQIASFYARRARRILPAAMVVLVATAVFAAVELSASRVTEVVADVRWAVFFAANVHFAQLGTDYFEQGRTLSPVQHFWSLAVEEQFYLFWPPLLLGIFLLVGRHRLRVMTFLVTAVWVTSLVWSMLLTPRSPSDAYFSSATRAWELATGVLVALAGNFLPHSPRLMRQLLSAVGLVAVVAPALAFDGSTPYPGWRALLPVLGTAALLAAGASGAVGAGRLLTVLPLRYVGDISYSLYLWHWPVFVFGAEYVGPSRSPVETTMLLGFTVAVSVLSYHVVENPVRRSGQIWLRSRRALVLWPATVATVVLATVWADAHATSVFEARAAGRTQVGSQSSGVNDAGQADVGPISQQISDALAMADAAAPLTFPLANYTDLRTDVWHRQFTCFASWDDSTSRLCPTGATESKRTMVVYGDSHAGMWLPPLQTLAARAGYRLVPLVKLGCGPFDVEQLRYGATYPQCPAFRAWAMRQIESIRPDVVVLAYRGLWAVKPRPGESTGDAWTRGVSATVGRLAQLTPSIKVISDVTAIGYSPASCITDPDSTMASCTVSERQEMLVGNQLTRRAATRLGADFIDVTDLVCLRHRCPLIVDHVVTYHDDSHLTVSWSNILTDDLGSRLQLADP